MRTIGGHVRLMPFAAAIIAALVLAPRSAAAGSQVLLSDSFTGATTSAPVIALGTAGFPCLTAGTDSTSTPVPGCNLSSPDAAGSGALRLTDAQNSIASGLLYDTSVPTSQGLTVTFDQYQYGSGYPADGIGFLLAAAPPVPSTLGLAGGDLGYVGLPGAWLGIGLDVFGNYLGDNGLADCTAPSWATAENVGLGYHPNTVTVRGPGKPTASGTTGYCLLTSNLDPTHGLGEDLTTDNAGFVMQGSAGNSSSDRVASRRGVQVVIDPSTSTYSVGIDFSGGTNYTTIISAAPLPTSYYDPGTGDPVTGVPPRITFGWAASTGAANDIHEITNLTVSTLNGPVPGLGLTNTDDVGGAPVAGTVFHYSLTPSVGSGGGPENAAITVSDPLPSGVTTAGPVTGTNWDCSASTASNISCKYTGGLPLAAGTTLPAIAVPVTVGPGTPVGSVLTNTATANSDDARSSVTAQDVVTTAAPPACTMTVQGCTVAPVATTGAAINLASRSATLTGTVRAGSASVNYSFEYGTSTAYGSSTSAATLAPSTTAAVVRRTITHLTPGTTYHYRLVANNTLGAGNGTDRTFTPPKATPKKLTERVTPSSDQQLPYNFTITGALTLPAGISPGVGCHGHVTITVKHGHDNLATKRLRLTNRCTYSGNIRLAAPKLKGKLAFYAIFGGNHVLTRKPAGITTARVG